MSSDEATSARAACMPADLTAGDPGLSLVGLLGVLDRADELLVRRRPRPRRSIAPRPEAYRRASARRVPLRPVPQAPAMRTVRLSQAGAASAFLAPAYLARHVVPPAGATQPDGQGRSSASRIAVAGVSRLRALTRRLALWGAGPDGAYLAWGSTPPRSTWNARPIGDRPVVLRELPSTPTIQPAAPSPAAALLPRGPASSAGPQGAPPEPRRAVPVPGVRPRGRLERSEATGWPSPNRSSSARPSTGATGLVRARGDPVSCPVRGSPLPGRRSRSPGSAWSSFP
jgi:hypothetical protein